MPFQEKQGFQVGTRLQNAHGSFFKGDVVYLSSGRFAQVLGFAIINAEILSALRPFRETDPFTLVQSFPDEFIAADALVAAVSYAANGDVFSVFPPPYLRARTSGATL